MRQISKPASSEFAPYASRYIDLLPDDGNVLAHLRDNAIATAQFITSISAAKLLYRYEPGKWTIKEIVAHVVDDERIYAYRTLRFARNDRTQLPGFEQDDYAATSGANDRDIQEILAEFATVRAATISLFEGLPEESFTRIGVADGNPMSVRAAAYHIAGHELRHMSIIRERYL